MQGLPGGGAMYAVQASEAEVAAALDGIAGVSVAAVNGPASVVVSGDAGAVEEVAGRFLADGRRVRKLRVSHAFHSHRMDPVLAELGQVAAGLAYAAPRVPWAGALAGELVAEPGPGYWAAQAREPVRFAGAVAALAAEGISVFLELGPDGTLSALAADGNGGDEVFVPLLRADQPGPAAVLAGLARAHVAGVAVDWAAVLAGGQRVELPTYAFARQRYWLQAPPARAAGGDGAGSAAEARFWAAVEGGDLAALAAALDMANQSRLEQVLPYLAAWRRRERDRSVTGGWRYRVTWAPVPDPDLAALSGTWLLVVPAGLADSDLARSCAQAMTARGAQVLPVETALGEADRAVLAGLLAQALAGPQDLAGVAGVAGVVSLLALAEDPDPAYPVVPSGLAGTLGLVQALGDAGIGAPLWVLTRGAVAAGPRDRVVSPVQAMAWGLGRVAALEHPDRWGGLTDLPPVLDERAAGRLVGVLAGCGEDQVAIRAGGVLARRLARAPRAGDDQAGRVPWAPRGTVLLTGGTGAIAGQVARWLAGRGTPRAVLASRSGPGAVGAAALAAELAGAGTAVAVLAADVADRAQVAGTLAWTGRGGPPLAAVMHTAGVLDDGVLDRLDTTRLATVLAAKAAAAAHLDELTGDLDAFVLFSSAAATFGGAGQGNYAAANSFLDALAENRRARGLAAVSVAWGPWAGGGLAQASEAVRQRVRRGALPAMDPALALGALGQAIDGPDAAVAVMDVDWPQFAAAPGASQAPFLRDLPEIRELGRDPGAGTSDGPGDGELFRQLAGRPPTEQARMLTDLVRTQAAAVLGHASPDAVPAARAFGELGFDSLTAVELRNRLAAATGLRLPATLVFDFPTPQLLAGYLRTASLDEDTGFLPVLGELDKLGAVLSAGSWDGDSRAQIRARLEALVRELDGGAGPATPATPATANSRKRPTTRCSTWSKENLRFQISMSRDASHGIRRAVTADGE